MYPKRKFMRHIGVVRSKASLGALVGVSRWVACMDNSRLTATRPSCIRARRHSSQPSVRGPSTTIHCIVWHLHYLHFSNSNDDVTSLQADGVFVAQTLWRRNQRK